MHQYLIIVILLRTDDIESTHNFTRLSLPDHDATLRTATVRQRNWEKPVKVAVVHEP